jgi:YD repeat-containing protein
MVRARLVVPVTVGALLLGFVPSVTASAETDAPGQGEGTSAFVAAEPSSARAQMPGVETVGPIAVTPSSGLLVAQGPPSLATVPDGRVVNPVQPYLRVDAVKALDSVAVRLWDLTAGADISATSGYLWEGKLERGWGRVTETLRPGRNYALTGLDESIAPDESGRKTWKLLGTFTVSPAGSRGGPVAQAAGISVSLPTGEAQWQWQSASLPGPTVDVGLGLAWNPSTTARAGLPQGWRLDPVGASAWATLSAYGTDEGTTAGDSKAQAEVCDAVTGAKAPRLVVMRGWNGASMSFMRNASGVYEQVAGGLRVPGYGNLLTPCEGQDKKGTPVINSWRFIDPDGLTTIFRGGLAVAVFARDVLRARLSWADGRLVSIESATGRSITAAYAGSASCASASWSGFDAPAAGMLCGIAYPDGTSTDIGYQGSGSAARIALIKDPGNQGTTLGWDSVGRLVALRSPLVNLAATRDPAAARVVTEVVYDSRTGRVTRLVGAPSEVGGPRVTQALTMGETTATTLREGRTVEARNATTATGVSGSLTYTLDPVTFEVREMTDATGLKTKRLFDSAGRPIGSIDSMGRRTDMTTDPTGALKRQAGPYDPGRDSRGVVQKTEYDETYPSRRDAGDKLEGFRADVFAEPGFRGRMEEAAFWKRERTRSGMEQRWTAKAPFSVRLTGLWTPDTKDDRLATDEESPGWTFTSETANATVSLIIGSFECGADELQSAKGCSIVGLPEGVKQVTIEVRKSGGNGSFLIKAAPTSTVTDKVASNNTKPVPGDQVVPGFQRVTRMSSNDSFTGATGDKITELAYANPALDAPTVITQPGGLESEIGYELVDPKAEDYGRPVQYTTPGDLVRRTTYWPTSGSVEAPGVCAKASAVASGQPRTRTLQDGTSVTGYYDVMGRLVAQVTTGADGATETRCVTYAPGGALATTTTFDAKQRVIESTASEDAVDGNPLVSRVTISHGPGAAVRPDTSVTTKTTVNLRGMPVEYIDEVGTVTRTTYTPLDDVATVTLTPKGADAPALTTQMRYRDKDAAVDRITVNGKVAAQVTYAASAGGRVSRISYGDAATADLAYGPTGRPISLSVLAKDTRVTQDVTYTEFGRATRSATSVSIKGFNPVSDKRDYSYDDARRLTRAAIETGGVRQVVDYAFDDRQASRCGTAYSKASADALRTGGTRGGVGYTTCYDARGRLASTTDPQVTGDATGKEIAEFAYDDFGRVTAITGGSRPAVLTWAGDTTLAKLVDGLGPDAVTTTMSTYGGRIVGKQVTGPTGSQEVHYGYGSGVDGSPSVIYAARDSVTGVPLSYNFNLPGAVNVVIPVDGVATMTFSGVDGSALGTIAAPFLSLAGSSGDQPGSPLGPSPRFGPYGEPLEAPRATTSPAMPDYAWQAAGQLETLGGPSSITLAGARPYLPGTGTFLAPDPRLDVADNLYSFTPGDPVNGSDGTGEANGWSWFFEIVGAALVVASFVVGAVSGGFLIPMALGMASAGLSMVAMKMQTEPSPGLDTFRTVMFWGQIAATVVTIGASLAMLSKWGANNGVVKLLAGAGRSLASKSTDTAARASARASIASVSSSLAESAAGQAVQPGKWARFVGWVSRANPSHPVWAEIGGTRAYLKSLGKLSGKWGSVVGAYKFQSWATEWVPESWKQAMQAQAAPAAG